MNLLELYGESDTRLLQRYKDTDLSPEQIIVLQAENEKLKTEPSSHDNGCIEKPLSVEELQERVGKPVWVETMNQWRIVIMSHDGENVNLYNAYNTISAKHVLSNDGMIYDRPLVEGVQGR